MNLDWNQKTLQSLFALLQLDSKISRGFHLYSLIAKLETLPQFPLLFLSFFIITVNKDGVGIAHVCLSGLMFTCPIGLMRLCRMTQS